MILSFSALLHVVFQKNQNVIQHCLSFHITYPTVIVVIIHRIKVVLQKNRKVNHLYCSIGLPITYGDFRFSLLGYIAARIIQ